MLLPNSFERLEISSFFESSAHRILIVFYLDYFQVGEVPDSGKRLSHFLCLPSLG